MRLSSGKTAQIGEITAGSGYLSSDDPRLHFGLGERTQVDRIEITWPSGINQVLEKVPADQILTITEPAK